MGTGRQGRGAVAAMGQGCRARSGDGAGIGQGSSYRSFVSCRSGKLRFHRGSKRERDINTRLSARPAETRGAAGRDLVPSISPHCRGAGTCWGSAQVGHTGSESLAQGPGVGPGLGICPSQDPTRSTPSPACPMARARRPRGMETGLAPPDFPTMSPLCTHVHCTPLGHCTLLAHRPSHWHHPLPTPQPRSTQQDSHLLSPELLEMPHGLASSPQHRHIPVLYRAPQPGAGNPRPCHSWAILGALGHVDMCVHVQAPSLWHIRVHPLPHRWQVLHDTAMPQSTAPVGKAGMLRVEHH